MAVVTVPVDERIASALERIADVEARRAGLTSNTHFPESRLRKAARELVEVDRVLHASAPAETWLRYTGAIARLREALGA